MDNYIKIGLKLTWLAVIAYWTISGWNVKKTAYAESLLMRFILYWQPLIAAALLLGPGRWFGHSWLHGNFVEHNNTVGIAGLLVAVAGAVIACNARYLLGRNRSVSVQRKERHELVTAGIYGVVRHPIYTGILLLFTGNTIIVGDYRGIIAVVIVLTALWLKLLKEEKLLLMVFGDRYVAYKSRTKGLIPFLL